MKKVKLISDTYIPGWGSIKAGTAFKVKRHNSRFVYVELGKCQLQLSVKDVAKIY